MNSYISIGKESIEKETELIHKSFKTNKKETKDKT